MIDSVERLSCQALLFDLDGVLVDSKECIETSWRDWAARHGVDVAAILDLAHGRRAVEVIRMVAPALDADHEAALLAEREASATTGLLAARGALELLSGIPTGNWAVVTSAVRRVAEHRLRCANLPTPSVLICAEDVARGKPDPEGYLRAARRLTAAPSDCIVVEDAAAGIDAAREAHMRSIGIASTQPVKTLARASAVASALSSLNVTVDDREIVPRLEVTVFRASTRSAEK